jgi:hypothetical protein
MKRRARELFSDTSSSSPGKRQKLTRADYEAFDSAIAPVEAASRGVRLASRCRGACIAAWRDHPEGFLQCVHDVLQAGVESPLRLLCAKVFARDHELGSAAASAQKTADPTTGGKTDERYSRFDI